MKGKGIIKSKAFPSVMLAVAAVGAILYYAARATWVFVDIALGIEGFTFGFLCVMIANAVLGGVLAAIRLYETKKQNEPFYKKKIYSVLTVISAVVSILSFTAGLIFLIIMADKESAGVYSLYFEKSLFKASFFILIPFLAVFLPLFNGKSRKAVTAVILALVSVIGICTVFPVGTYEITCDPTVIDTGKDYSIVFSASNYGTGYVEYTYNGKEYKVYDENEGRLNADTLIHSINIPYEHLNNNTYKIGSVRVFEQYSYGSRTGKEVVSDEYKFTPVSGDDITFLVISDWHTEIQRVYDTVEYVGDYDAVLLMGDSSPGFDFEEEAVRNTVELAGTLSNGTKPVIYARGNHETRGAYAGKLADALGLEDFYYTADMGSYSFVVLDSGEDKEDSHPEYGGMNDYNTYRSEMVEWLRSTETNNDKVIALSHDWRISSVEEELSQSAWNELDRLGTKLVISGHSHQCRLLGETEEEKTMISAHPGITGFMDGGNSGDVYVASKMTLSAERIYLESYNNSGEKVFEHSVDW